MRTSLAILLRNCHSVSRIPGECIQGLYRVPFFYSAPAVEGCENWVLSWLAILRFLRSRLISIVNNLSLEALNVWTIWHALYLETNGCLFAEAHLHLQVYTILVTMPFEETQPFTIQCSDQGHEGLIDFYKKYAIRTFSGKFTTLLSK